MVIAINETADHAVISFAVRVSPGAAATKVLGEHDGALKMAVCAAPEKGKANKALTEFLSRALGVRKQAVTVAAGETSRNKRVEVEGISKEALREQLESLIEKN